MSHLTVTVLCFAFTFVKCQGFHCNAHDILNKYPPRMIEFDETPAAARPHQSPSVPWTDIRIDYHIVPSTSSRTGAMLRKAFDDVNKKLRSILKVQGEGEMRMAPRDKRSTDCLFPAVDQLFSYPGEHHAPCSLSGIYIPEPGISLNNSQENRLLESQHLGHLIYVVTRPHALNCLEPEKIAFSAIRNSYALNGFPYSGVIVFCHDPNLLGQQGQLSTTLLHETIHILTFASFISNKEYVLGVNSQSIGNLPLNQAQAKDTRWMQIPPVDILYDRTPIVIKTSAVLHATREYFKCSSPNLHGAEVARKVRKSSQAIGAHYEIYDSDFAHWNDRLFPDEIMGTTYGEGAVLSKLTLAVLKETGWYQVDMSKADPMMFDATERNIEGDGCDVALRDCGAVMNRAQATWESTPYKLPWVGPFCSSRGDVPTRACSPDGRFRLECTCGNGDMRAKLSFCCIYIKNSSMDGRPIDCLKDYSQTLSLASYKKNQKGVTCVTFQSYKHTFQNNNSVEVTISKENYPVCMVVECGRDGEYVTNNVQLSLGNAPFGQKTIKEYNLSLAVLGILTPMCMTERGLCPKITAQEPCLPDHLIGNVGAMPSPFVKRTTYAGRTCQQWRDVAPQFHQRFRELPENFCRNPDGNNPIGPWCYTMDANKRSESCFYICSHSPVVRERTWCGVLQGSKLVCPDYVQMCEGSGPLGPLAVSPPTNLIVDSTTDDEMSGCNGPKTMEYSMILLFMVYYILQHNRK